MTPQIQQLSQPTENDILEAGIATAALSKILSKGKVSRVELQTKMDSKTGTTSIPSKAFELMIEILGQMANGNIVAVVPIHAELTTQQAADLLNVSRPYVVKLIEADKLPATLVGTRRRVRMGDLIAYKQRDAAKRKAVLRKLTQEAQEMGIGYEQE